MIISREEAAAQKKTHFFTGKPCRYGHTAPRFVSTGGCSECNAARASRFRKDAPAFFYYALHPGDVATVLAVCQACDIQRGRTPSAANQVMTGKSPRGVASSEDIAAARRDAFGAAAQLMVGTAPRPEERREP